jgi:hypothetical protein
MSLIECFYLKTGGGLALHYAPDRGHLQPLLQAPDPDLRRLLVFRSEESAQRYASRINLGPSFHKVAVSPVAELMSLVRRHSLPQKFAPAFYLEPAPQTAG